MDIYIGIDIGTTNSKALVYDGEGNLVKDFFCHTEYKTVGGLKFFDVKAIDVFVDSIEEQASKIGTVRSVGFSSIGESTIPVDEKGRVLFNAPLWSEVPITANEEERRIITASNSFMTTGICQNGLLALDKILWMRRNYPETRRAKWYLPFSSYEVFRKTGLAVWDYSQALRSNAFLVHKRIWNTELLDKFGLHVFGALAPMGTACGEKHGIIYGLGGHDHITGLYSIYSMLHENHPSFFYESMGTSAVLALLMGNGEQNYPQLATYNPIEGSFLPGFRDNEFGLTRSFRRFGELNSFWMRLGGREEDHTAYAALAEEMESRPYKQLSLMVECDSDFIRGNSQDGVLNFYHVNPSADVVDYMRSIYLYLAVGAHALEDVLRKVVGISESIPYVAGGAVTRDALFMTLRATALGHDIQCLRNKEISALGGVYVGMHAAGATNAIKALSTTLLRGGVSYHPYPKYESWIADAKEQYEALKRSIDGRRI